MDPTVVDLVSILMKIQDSETDSKERQNQISMISNTNTKVGALI